MLRTLGNGKLWNSLKTTTTAMKIFTEKEEGKRFREDFTGRIRFTNGLSTDRKVIRAVHRGHRVHGAQRKSEIYSDLPVEKTSSQKSA